MNALAIRGAAAFGLPVLILLVAAVATSLSRTGYVLAAGPICGVIGSLAFGRRRGLPLVLALSFGFVGAVFLLQDGRSPDLIDVVITGAVSAFLFWVVGLCATLTLPAQLRFVGANAFAIPGGIGGMTFQFFYGPAHFALDLGSRSWWETSLSPHLILWIVAGTGTGYLLGRQMDRLQQAEEAAQKTPRKSSWALASVLCGLAGLGIGALSFTRHRLPLGLINSFSPASAAADWLRSWGVLTLIVGTIAVIHTFRRASRHHGRSLALTGMMLAVALLAVSQRFAASPWKTGFNTNYGERVLREHGNSSDPDSADAIYTGNLILAQASLDDGDIASAGRFLLAAGTTTGTRKIQESGPDTSVARILLQRGERDTVVEYLRRCRNFWPQGTEILNRWETAIRAGRQPNFNNRATNPPGTSPERR